MHSLVFLQSEKSGNHFEERQEMMLELLLETNYFFLTVASVATVLVVVISWRVIFSKQAGKELEDSQVCNHVKYS